MVHFDKHNYIKNHNFVVLELHYLVWLNGYLGGTLHIISCPCFGKDTNEMLLEVK